MTVLYEVRLTPQPAIAEAFLTWLRKHQAEVAALPGFEAASIHTEEDTPTTVYVATYRLKDRAALQSYFDHHAARMRGEGLALFPDQFTATRRVLLPLP